MADLKRWCLPVSMPTKRLRSETSHPHPWAMELGVRDQWSEWGRGNFPANIRDGTRLLFRLRSVRFPPETLEFQTTGGQKSVRIGLFDAFGKTFWKLPTDHPPQHVVIEPGLPGTYIPHLFI